MSSAKQCDRCGKLYSVMEAREADNVLQNQCNNISLCRCNAAITMDLCLDCAEDFSHFWNHTGMYGELLGRTEST